LYDVRVTGPDGSMDLMGGGYRVTSTQADRLELTPVDERPVVTVFETVEVDLAVVDPEGAPLNLDLPVHLVVSAASGSASGLDITGNLTDLSVTFLDPASSAGMADGGWWVQGRLPADGTARLALRSSSPVELVVQAETTEEGVSGDTTFLTWDAGSGYRVDVSVPFTAESPALAGQRFDVALTLRDEFGNVVEDPRFRTDAVLVDACGDLFPVAVPDLRGTRVLPSLRLRRATGGEGCATQALQVILGSEVHRSEDFAVLPASAARFDVAVASTTVVAGQPQRATVQAVDAWGNAVFWSGRADRLRLTDTAGDVVVTGCAPGDNFVTCTFTPTDAESGVVLQVVDPDSTLVGYSQPYVVQAANLDHLTVTPDLADVGRGIRAGQPFGVVVRLRDEFGNDVPGERFVEGDVVVTDVDREEAHCDWLGPAERGELLFRCTLFTADETVALQARSVGGPVARSTAFPVINGELARVDLVPSRSTVPAGDTVSVVVSGLDAWGNLYKVHSSGRVDLEDLSGTWSAKVATLSTDGTTRIEGLFTQAGSTRIRALRSGVELGVSPEITVQAGRPSSLRVASRDPWSWRGLPSTFVVRAVDAWGNAADLDDTVTLSAASGGAVATEITLVDGAGTGVLTWSSVSTSEIVRARAATGLSGEKGDHLVVTSCSSSGPSLTLSFDGERDAVACHDGVEASISASFSGSAQSGGKAPLRYALAVGYAPGVEGESVSTSASDVIEVDIAAEGTVPLRALVVGDGACAVETTRTAWLGPDDGQPVGPIPVSLSKSTLASGRDTATLSVSGVTTCDGDPASKGRVYLRTNLGDISGATASGKGLRLTLDSSGDGSVTLDLVKTRTGGAGRVVAWAESGAAGGQAVFTATGDSQRPRVVEQNPRGFRSAEVSSVRLKFSEPLDRSSVVAGAFSVAGPSPVSVDGVTALSDSEVEVRFSSALSTVTGKWTLTAASSLRDVAGNGLDGGWDGRSGDHTASFGKVSALAPDLTACGLLGSVIRPDGDDGRGAEADKVSAALSASRAASTWILEVYAADGRRVLLDRVGASGSKTGTVVWDGRDQAGSVVANGEYDLVYYAENTDGTAGATCGQSVLVDNHR
jgi:hypothetical protein